MAEEIALLGVVGECVPADGNRAGRDPVQSIEQILDLECIGKGRRCLCPRGAGFAADMFSSLGEQGLRLAQPLGRPPAMFPPELGVGVGQVRAEVPDGHADGLGVDLDSDCPVGGRVAPAGFRFTFGGRQRGVAACNVKDPVNTAYRIVAVDKDRRVVATSPTTTTARPKAGASA